MVLCGSQSEQTVDLAGDGPSFTSHRGVYVGSRDEKGAFGLWDSLPDAYTDAHCFTDALPAYRAVIYGGKHHVGKDTQHIERFNCTLRQRAGP